MTIILLVNNHITGQVLDFKFKHITSSDGLSDNSVESIYQDSRGYIWFGTRDGLNQFDGYDIKIFKNDSKDPNSISDNYIKSICEDRYHNLWIGTSNGLNRFNPNNNTFIRYIHNQTNCKSLSANEINCIYTDNEGELWIGTTGGGLNLYNFKTKEFKHFSFKNNDSYALPSNDINDLYEDKNSNFWIGTANGLRLFNRKNGTFLKRFKILNGPITTIPYAISKIRADKQGNLWIGTIDNGVFLYNISKGSLSGFYHNDKDPSSLSTNLIRCILVDKNNKVWIGGINGSLDQFVSLSGKFIHSMNKPGDPLSISQKTVSTIFEDNQNDIWIGTPRGGVNLYAPLADKFQLTQQGFESNSLSYNDVRTFYEDQPYKIWIGTDGGGLNLFDAKTNIFRRFKYNVYNKKSISSDAVLSVNEDHYKNVWIGTWGGGLNLFNRSSYTFSHFTNVPNDKYSISSNYVVTTLEDSEGDFWVATYNGLDKLDLETHKFYHISGDPSGKTSLFGNNIVSLNEDHEKNLWIGTVDGGLNCYNLERKKFKHYFIGQEKNPTIDVIFTDRKGRVWIGQNGLYLFNKSTESFAIYTNEAGLASESIRGITQDNSGNLWISSSNGLTKFDPDTHKYEKYNIADGLQGLEFEIGATLKTKSGEMYFGGTNGFNHFFPRNIKLNQFQSPVYITNFQLFDEPVLPGKKGSPLKTDISLTHQITLNYTESSLAFEFAMLNFAAPQNNHYTYILKGFEKSWHLSNSDRKAIYTNINPGHYVFFVKASNNDGIWNNDSAYLNITITPPYWETLWFRLLSILFLITCAYYLLRFKKNLDMRKIEEKKRQEIHQVQLQFFTNISHEFRTPLSLILGPLEKIMSEDIRMNFQQYYESIHRNANRLLLLINELMDFRKAETGVLKLKVMPGNLQIFITEIADDFKSIAVQKNISLCLKVEENIGEIWFDRQIMEKILLNLMDNAFKYTQADGRITIELYLDVKNFASSFSQSVIIESEYKGTKYVYIRVSDTGIGISKDSIQYLFERYYRITDSHMGSGVGLAFVKSLTLLHKGRISVYSERQVGSDVIVAIPISKNDYKLEERWVSTHSNLEVQLESLKTSFYQNDFKENDYAQKDNDSEVRTGLYKILIVDDNEELRSFLRSSLKEFYEIIEANDGISGLIAAQTENPDLIISDLMMPKMDGVEFCRHIKTEAKTNKILFIILSAKDTIDAKIAGASSGADLYFPKPVSIQLLLISIKNLLKRREQLIRNYFLEGQEDVESSNDKNFMDELTALIEAQISNPEMDVDFLSRQMAMSRTKLYHKLKGISGYSIAEYIRVFRLRKAAQIMSHEDVLLTDVVYRVGMQTQSYFTKMFKKEFGKTPSQFLNEIKDR